MYLSQYYFMPQWAQTVMEIQRSLVQPLKLIDLWPYVWCQHDNVHQIGVSAQVNNIFGSIALMHSYNIEIQNPSEF